MKKILIIFIVTFNFSFSESSGLAKDIPADKNFIDGVHYTKHWAWVTPSSSDWAKVVQPKKCGPNKSRDILTYSIRNLSVALKTPPSEWLKGDYLDYINDTCSIYFEGTSSFKNFDKAIKKWKTKKYIESLKEKYPIIGFGILLWDVLVNLAIAIVSMLVFVQIFKVISGRFNKWQN